MVEQADLLLEHVRVVLEVVLVSDVLFLDSLNVEEVVLTVGQDLGGVVEVDADHVVAQDVADPVLRGVVDPFFDGDVAALGLDY